MKKLYYTVNKETTNVGGDFEEVTGNKEVSVYEIIDNVPTPFFTLDLELSQNSEEEIQEYLDDNGHGDETFEFIKL
jgi:hypothetical protein